MRTKTAAMEMSIGTLVTIVLLMTVLILGIIFVQKIFAGGTTAIDDINDKVKSEINKAFTDETAKTALIPGREIKLEKGKSGGVAFSIKNTDRTSGSFSYETEVAEIERTCTLSETEAENLMTLGKNLENIQLGSGDSMEARLIKFTLPENSPLCIIRYTINVEKDNKPYTSTYFDLEIIS